MIEKYTSPEETLSEIRQLMERSSRFISLSGFSGVFAGIYALIGAAAAWYYVNMVHDPQGGGEAREQLLLFLVADAFAVLFLAVTTGIYLTTRKAKKDGNSLFDAAARKLILNLCIPLVAGGVFCLALIYNGDTRYVASAMLIFYGLALLHASKYTRNDIRSLGVAEIILGLISLWVVGHQLLLWAIGFGLLHIAYGIYMYFKYEK